MRASLTRNEDWLTGLTAAPRDDQLVRELRDVVCRGLSSALRRRAIDEDELEDFTQEAVIRILERLDTFRGDSKFTTWAVAVAIRIALTHLRRRRARSVDLDEVLHAAPDRGPSTSAEADELLGALRAAIDRDLTELQRTAVLAELAGMPTVVIAERLGTNPNALYKLHHDARRRLRRSLADAGFSDQDVRSYLSDAS